MSSNTLTADEKRCLQMWFRQAIVQLEQEEACRNIINFYNGDGKARDGHHSSPSPRRARRVVKTHGKELV